MIKYWQSMQDYKYFLNESKVHFDSSERVRLHTELWKPWQKLRLFDTDKAMEFLLPFYSNTGRPAKNQPQILRSFILFFLLFSEGLAKLSLTLWVDRLKHDRLLPLSSAALRIPCRPSVLILTSWTGSGLQRFFYHVAVLPSMESGLIPREHLTVSGDGTAVHTHACPRGHHRVGAPENLRHFPDPDASWGWDSDLEKYYSYFAT
ncbi:hypothetical protein [Sporofaciens sp. JLR.KK001]|uniref:hypothetical protein n=1 Tax=Sporofaciens sp. JLR.KK001 TaxID=3112621 RepID=UPI002FF1966B